MASARSVGNIREEVEKEADIMLGTLKELIQEKLEYEEMEAENKMMRSEVETIESDLQEMEETKGKLWEEAGELMEIMVANREKTKSIIPKLKQEVRELQVKLSCLLQTGNPRTQFNAPGRRFTFKTGSRPPLQPPAPASNFVFKRK